MLAAQGRVERAVRGVIRDQGCSELELEGGPIGNSQTGGFGVDLARDLVLPTFVRAFALEDA